MTNTLQDQIEDYAERKGWHFLERGGIYNGHPVSSADATTDLEELHKRGATHLVFYSSTFWWLDYYKEFTEHLARNATLVEGASDFHRADGGDGDFDYCRFAHCSLRRPVR